MGLQRLKKKEKEKTITLARAVSKMKNKILNAALISWVEKIQRKKKYQRYALKLYNRKKQSIFWTWTCYVQEEMHRRTLMARVVARLSKLKLFHSMQRWKNNVRVRIMFKKKKEEEKKTIMKAIQSMRNQRLHTAMNKWVTYVISTRKY